MKSLTDRLEEVKVAAKENIGLGAIIEPYYSADRTTVLQFLNEALASELTCVLRYRSHYGLVTGLNSSWIKKEFSEYAEEEQRHSEKIAARIIQLGGKPDYNPDGLSMRSHTSFGNADNLSEMLKENLIAERIIIGIYQEFIRYLGDTDLTTRRLMEDILSEEEEHAEKLLRLQKEGIKSKSTPMKSVDPVNKAG